MMPQGGAGVSLPFGYVGFAAQKNKFLPQAADKLAQNPMIQIFIMNYADTARTNGPYSAQRG
jgi:hypothetical protein